MAKSSFDQVQSALRVRDVIARAARGVVKTEVESPTIARTVSVDLPNMKAMVWIAGDPQPVPAIILPGAIPASWATRDATLGAVNTSIEGTGSMVVITNYQGQLYVVDVLTGGEFSYNAQALNMTSVELLPWDGTGLIVGERGLSRFALRVRDIDDSPVPSGGAIMFGPFMADQLREGTVDVWLSNEDMSKHYKFNLDVQSHFAPPAQLGTLVLRSSVLANMESGAIDGLASGPMATTATIAAWADSTVQAHSGTHSRRSASLSTVNPSVSELAIAIPPGATDYSFWYYFPSGTYVETFEVVRGTSGSSRFLTTTQTAAAARDTWINVTGRTFDATAMTFRVSRNGPLGPSGALRVFVDDISFSYSDSGDTGLDRWYRVLPQSEDWKGASSEGDEIPYTLDLDVAVRSTDATVDTFGSKHNGIYFRVIPRHIEGEDVTLDLKVRIESNLFTSAQGFRGEFDCEVVEKAITHVGYLGIHGYDGLKKDLYAIGACDDFVRDEENVEWGIAQSGERWGGVYNATNHYVEDGVAHFGSGTAGFFDTKLIDPTVEVGDMTNCVQFAVFAVDEIPGGTGSRDFGFLFRCANYLSLSSAASSQKFIRVFVRVAANTGAMTWIMGYVDGAGTAATIASGTLTDLTPYTEGQLIAIKAYVDGNNIGMKVWDFDEMTESDAEWNLGTSSVVTTNGSVGVYMDITATATLSEWPADTKVFHWEARQIRSIEAFNDVHGPVSDGPYRAAALRQTQLMQTLAFVEGPFTYDDVNFRVSWGSASIVLSGVGQHKDGLLDGFCYVNMPADGVQIPKFPSGDFSTVASGGIPLLEGESLWFGVPPGTPGMDMVRELFIVDESPGGFVPPEWCICVGVVSYDFTGNDKFIAAVRAPANPYPVGAVYTSALSTDPATLFGGTWTQITDRFPVAAGSTFTAGGTGGAANTTLTGTELPAHVHAGPSHQHNVGRDHDGASASATYTVHDTGTSGAGGTSPTSSSGTGNTGSAGSGSSFTNAPPWQGFYMWVRTA